MLTKGWKARTDTQWAVHKGMKEISLHAWMGTYDIGSHRVDCNYLREVLRIPEPTYGTVVVFLDG